MVVKDYCDQELAVGDYVAYARPGMCQHQANLEVGTIEELGKNYCDIRCRTGFDRGQIVLIRTESIIKWPKKEEKA